MQSAKFSESGQGTNIRDWILTNDQLLKVDEIFQRTQIAEPVCMEIQGNQIFQTAEWSYIGDKPIYDSKASKAGEVLNTV